VQDLALLVKLNEHLAALQSRKQNRRRLAVQRAHEALDPRNIPLERAGTAELANTNIVEQQHGPVDQMNPKILAGRAPLDHALPRHSEPSGHVSAIAPMIRELKAHHLLANGATRVRLLLGMLQSQTLTNALPHLVRHHTDTLGNIRPMTPTIILRHPLAMTLANEKA
jgi:hypothetical protein